MQHALLGLIAETAIHAGTGKSAGVIDLPIMREAHTGWPCVVGSAVKGALRCKAEQENRVWIADVFGPDRDNASDHAGALAVGDARLLLLPIRSLTSHFKWVACPALLERANADARRMGGQVVALPGPIADEQALTPEQEGSLFLEEFHFKAEKRDLSALVAWLGRFVDADGETQFAERLKKQLVLVSDDMFAHLAVYATPVAAHIAIDNTRKTVIDGALWYEETLPPETVLYLTLAASDSRKNPFLHDAAHMLNSLLSLFPAQHPYLQVGGNETVGMGWCRVNRVDGEHNGKRDDKHGGA